MNWEAIQAVSQVQAGGAIQEGAALPASQRANGIPFGEMVSRGIAEVNQRLLTTEVDLQNLAMGKTENLHQVMIRLEESRLSFQLFMQVRSRLLEAYQDVMKMQV